MMYLMYIKQIALFVKESLLINTIKYRNRMNIVPIAVQEWTVKQMADWQIEQVAVGIAVLALFIHLAAWSKLCDRVTRLEALLKLLENEIKLIHERYGEQNENN